MFFIDMHTHGQNDRCSHTTVIQLLQRVLELRQGINLEKVPGLSERCNPSVLESGFYLHGIVVVGHGFAPSFSKEEKDYAKEHQVLLLAGIEAYTDEGELLVYGIGQTAWEGIFLRAHFHPREIIDAVEKSGGVSVPAHPFRQLYPYVWNLNRPGIHVIEELNGGQLYRPNEIARELVAGNGRFAGIGGSDAHHTAWLGQCLTVFSQDVLDEGSLIETLKKGKNGGYKAAYLYELLAGRKYGS